MDHSHACLLILAAVQGSALRHTVSAPVAHPFGYILLNVEKKMKQKKFGKLFITARRWG